MNGRGSRSGQVAIFLVLILTGLVLLFALNMDIFTSSRAKIRLQNAADSSALALARWQGITLNMIGDLNIAMLAAICKSNETAMAGIAELQSRLAFIGPTAGFKAANDIAKANGISVSGAMTDATRRIAESVDARYRSMLDAVLNGDGGIRAGVDNAAIIRAGSADPRLDPDFYAAIASRDFRTLCCRYGGGGHKLPEVPPCAPDPDETSISGENACFGSIGVCWEDGAGYVSRIPRLAQIADDFGFPGQVSAAGLLHHSNLFTGSRWCVYDRSEWRDVPSELGLPMFPWLKPLKEEFRLFGGGSTVRIEGSVELAGSDAPRYITAQAAAKAFGSAYGRKVTRMDPPMVLPSFSQARLVPYAFGAAGRYGMANQQTVLKLLGLLGRPGGICGYESMLIEYNGERFRSEAANWYSQHGHNDADGCRPVGKGTEREGGTPYGI